MPLSLQRLYSLYRPLLVFMAAALAFLSVARLFFVTAFFERVAGAGGLGFVLVQGLRFDLVLLCMVLAVPALLTPWLGVHARSAQAWSRLLGVLMPVLFALLVFMELATPAFMDEYGTRPNYLFVEYLRYPHEVFGMLWTGYKTQVVLAAIVVPLLTFGFHRWLRRDVERVSGIPAWQAVLLFLVSVPVLTLGIRSTMDHRPVNPSTVAFSTDPLVNSLPLNSTYSMLYAVYERRHENAIAEAELSMPAQEIFAGMRAQLRTPLEAWITNDAIPTLHAQTATFRRDRPLNLVIILQESLGAEFVGALGGLPLTPNLDALANEGIWFENLYATGTRSVQGIEAVITGFLPMRASSTVKLPGSQDNFFTLASLLARQGYATSFIYGGDADFDNMRRFFMNNGFDQVIDERSFEAAAFRSSWGVSDEDMFARAHRYFMAQPETRPFFSLLFTTSNHSPFEIPPGKIEPYDPGRNTVNNAVQYADYALGQFIGTARQAPYWENTLFLIVADHNSRVKGVELVPIERFHIPGLLLGAHIAPQRVTRLVSQIDLLPSLLSWMGIDSVHPAIGDDLTRPEVRAAVGRTVMKYHGTMAYREGDRVVIEAMGKPLRQFRYEGGRLEPLAEIDEALNRRAMLYFEWPVATYRDRGYRLPAAGANTTASVALPQE